VELVIAAQRRRARSRRKVVTKAPPQVRNLLKAVAKAAELNNLRQSAVDTMDSSNSQTRTILIPVI
jgi:hypothetical protein